MNSAHTKFAYTVEEAAELLSMSRSQMFRLIDLMEISTIKIGKLRRVTHAQLDAFLRKMEQANGFSVDVQHGR